MLNVYFHRAMARLEERLVAGEPEAFTEAIVRSLRMKARVVARDPNELLGARTVLNLGHTVAHALETATSHRLWHGEAVAWGLLAALRLSRTRAGLAPEVERLPRPARVLRLTRPPVLKPVLASASSPV